MSDRRQASAIYTVDGTPVEVSHPDKVLWPGEGITKRELVEYYLAVAPLVLPFLCDRPLTLKPYPRGIRAPSFFLRTRPANAPAWLAAVPYQLRTEDETTCPIVARDARTLAWCAGYNAIELHPWLSRVPHLDRPDVLMFDLDPGPELPELVTLDYRIERRPGLVLVDYSQNSIAKSTVAPYSVRPVPGARVSTPLTWIEVEAGEVEPAAFMLRTLATRVERVGNLIEGFEAARAPLF